MNTTDCRCLKCDGRNIQMPLWVDVNTGLIRDDLGPVMDGEESYFCADCKAHRPVTSSPPSMGQRLVAHLQEQAEEHARLATTARWESDRRDMESAAETYREILGWLGQPEQGSSAHGNV